jgi:hypothetical protein
MRPGFLGTCVSVAIGCVLGGTLGLRQAEAQQPAPLPSNWQSLGVSDFINAVAPYYDNDSETLFYPTIDDNGVRTQAATLIANVDYSGSQYDLPTLNTLHMLANPLLAATDQTRITNAVTARQDNWSGQPFSSFNAKWNLMYRLRFPDLSRIQEGTRWVQAGGQLSAVPPECLPEAYLYFAATTPQAIYGGFTVQWQGQATAPQTGAYTFSISSINVNSTENINPVQVSMTVSVGGTVILSANANQWTASSTPVTLTAGQAVPLLVAWSCQTTQQIPTRALHAMLSWQGPGVPSSIVPQSVLTLPDGSAQGLQARYTWTNQSGQQQTLTRTEPNIDVVWTSRPVWLLADVSGQNQAGATFVQTATSTNYLSPYLNLTAPVQVHQLHAVFQDPDATGQILTSAQRNTILNMLQSQPSLLSPVSANQFVTFFGTYRFGNPEPAIQTFGVWVTANADITCKLGPGPDFDSDNRTGYRRMAVYVTQQLPQQAAEIQSQFLVTPDGRCCLPVAYALAYAALGQNNLTSWTNYLDAQLANSNLTGDLRVNWLLARALATEIGQAQPPISLSNQVYTRPTDGMKYVFQAAHTAQSAAVKVRVAQESAARQASAGRYDAATSTLQAVLNSASPAQQAILTTWINQLAGYSAVQANSASTQGAAALQAYITTLRQRRDQASAIGDTASVNRYNAIINALTSQ